MAFPLLYIIYTLARGAIVNWYPYFFVNPNRGGGYLLVAGDCLAVGIGILALIAATAWAGNRRSDASAATSRRQQRAAQTEKRSPDEDTGTRDSQELRLARRSEPVS